jgi:hypothetical protein
MSRFLVRIGTSFVLSCLVILLLNCKSKPAPGGTCTNVGRYVCQDPTTALFCNAGKYQAIPCSGLKGCSGGTLNPSCDDDLAKLGDACMSTTNENYACATDHNSALVCRDGKFQLWRACKGAKHCQVHLDKVDCDNTIGDVGDPCGTSGSFVCSTDHKMLLMCQSEKLMAANSCRGPKECRLLADNKNHCDDSQAQEGDPCDTPDEVSCSMDGKSEVVCKGNKYVVKQLCKRKDGCVVRDGQLLCAF